jgi:hypothetical protein
MDQETLNYSQQQFSLPHDVVPLPSQGVFYKNKKSSIKVGYLTASDENILMAGGKDMTLNLLRAKIYEPGLKPEELLEGDIEAILVFLRNTAFGPSIELNLTDPKTNKRFQATERLDELNIKKGEEPDADGTFSVRLPVSEKNIKLKPLSFGETTEISNMSETYPQGRIAPVRTWRLQKEIVAIEGTTDKGEIHKFIESMPLADSKYIKKFMNENEPRLDMVRVVITPSGEKLSVNIGFGVDFFRPFF